MRLNVEQQRAGALEFCRTHAAVAMKNAYVIDAAEVVTEQAGLPRLIPGWARLEE